MGNSMDKILPGLYVGNIRGATNKKILDSNQITHILSIFDRAEPVIEDRVYLCIKANDVASQDLTQYFSQCIDFIHNARVNKGTVLVHCVAGMSRSVTVTTAYIMTITDLGWREALNAVRGARKCANPNFGFQRQLLAFYHDLLSKEKKRFTAIFPRSPYADKEECDRLIEVHRQWVLHGDEGERDDSETTYPLQHNAYQPQSATNDDSTSNQSTAQNKPSELSVTCSLCSCVFITEASSGASKIDCSDPGEVLCEKCTQCEQETLNLVETAPDVTQLQLPSTTSTNGDQACASSYSPEADHQMDTGASEALVDAIFSDNTRKKGREVCFSDNVQISKVENIDSKMAESVNSSCSLQENNSGASAHGIEIMTRNLKITNNNVMDIPSEALVEDLFKSNDKPKVNKL